MYQNIEYNNSKVIVVANERTADKMFQTTFVGYVT